MSKLNQEDLWDECALAFNSALQRAHDQYPYRWERINQAKEQIKEMIQKSEVTEEWIEKMVEESAYILHQDKYTFFERKFKEVGVEIITK